MRALLAIFAALLWALVSAPPVRAYIPLPERIAAAVAAANKTAGRLQVLRVDLALYLGASDQPVATGQMLSDPKGIARLELRSSRGAVERHLLRGGELLAGRDGRPLDSPRPFLMPFFLLQAASGDGLMATLASLGVSTHQVDLGYQDERDCYVLGGRLPASGSDVLSPRPALWVDQESLEVVRFDRGDGVRFRLGTPASFGPLRLPSWIEIRDSRGFQARLEVLSAEEGSSPPGSFLPAWLGAP